MRILLVEDHKRLSQSIVEGLCNFGFGVDSFFTAEEGVGAVKSLACRIGTALT
jgi:DNA-binding response OmpR family regulator